MKNNVKKSLVAFGLSALMLFNIILLGSIGFYTFSDILVPLTYVLIIVGTIYFLIAGYKYLKKLISTLMNLQKDNN